MRSFGRRGFNVRSACFLLGLSSFVALAFANFVTSFVRSLVYGYPRDPSPSSPENVILLGTILTSGLVINVGTILQIISQCRGRNTQVNIKYTQCLVAGCFVLLVGQVHSSMNDLLVATPANVNWATFLATPVTTLLSFLCSAVFYFITTRLSLPTARGVPTCRRVGGLRTDEVDSFRDTSREILCAGGDQSDNDEPLRLVPAPRRRQLVFLEGTACIGKTTVSDQTFDFAHYIQLYPDYLRKNDELYMQSLYEANLYADTLYAMINEDEESAAASARPISRSSRPSVYLTRMDERPPTSGTTTTTTFAADVHLRELRDDDRLSKAAKDASITFFDRSPFSQIAYAILYKFNGESCEPHLFAEQVDQLFADEQFVAELTNVLRKWVVLFHQLYRNVDVRVIWFGAQSPSATVERLLQRNSMEVAQPGWNLLYFMHNQNTLFRTLQAKTNFGEYRETAILRRADLIDELLNQRNELSSGKKITAV